MTISIWRGKPQAGNPHVRVDEGEVALGKPGQWYLLCTMMTAVAAMCALSDPLPIADPFIGTAGVGHMSPAATCPFGMVQAGPDTSASPDRYAADWPHTSGYQFGDGYVFRFSQTRVFGTGCGSLGNIGLLPFVDEPASGVYSSALDKGSERARPGHYAVRIGGAHPIACEIAAGEHTAHYRFAFRRGERMRLLLDADWGIVGPAASREWRPFAGRVTRQSEVRFDDATSAVGRIDVADWVEYSVSFALRFSRPVAERRQIRKGDGLRGDTFVLDFGEAGDAPLEVCVGLSATSPEAARRNLAAEMGDFDFDGHLRSAEKRWQDVLSRVALGAETDATVATNFHSALYRACLQPHNLADVGEPPRYSTFSLWDTYRAAHPLYTVLCPERVDGFIQSMLAQYREQGYLPIWPLWGKDTHCMVGHHAVPVIVDAYLKGFRGFDVDSAYAAVADSLTNVHVAASRAMWGLLKEDWPNYDRYGYIPLDGMEERPTDGRPVRGESVSRTLECAYDDACAARFAAALGKTEDARRFKARSESWRNLLDPATGFMRGRRKDGSWRTPFDPLTVGHCWWQDNDFTEGNSWQWTWHVMHDPDGLVAALGGRERFGRKLSALFEADSKLVAAANVVAMDVSGLIGQYAHGNEPSHHVAYFFRWSDTPHKTDELVGQIVRSMYKPIPDGLCGNDDCGQMSAWYIFSALGFYPFDPCGGEYVIGAPQVPKAKVKLANGKTFEVVAKGFSKESRYVKSVTLNGRPVTDWKIRHADIMAGGELVFEMAGTAAVRSKRAW